MAGMSTLTAKGQMQTLLQAQNNLTPQAAGPIQNVSTVTKTFSLGTAAANNAANGADECALFITSVGNSGNSNIDLTNITDLLNTAAVSLSRVKWTQMQLLSAADDSANGNTCSSCTIGNNGTNDWISQSHSGWLATAASVFDLPNGGCLAFGTPSANGVVVDGTHKLIHVVNNDAGNSAKFQLALIGGST